MTTREAAIRELELIQTADPWIALGSGALTVGGRPTVIKGQEAREMTVSYGDVGRVIVYVSCDRNQVVRVEWLSFATTSR